MKKVSGFVLAGGRSSRMGSDKALLPYGQQTLLQRALKTMGAATDVVFLVGPAERYHIYGNTIEDVYRECGPLGGIHAALRSTTTELNLFLSVDMPLITAPFLTWLVSQATEGGSELAIVPKAMGGLQPLCAVYRRQLGVAAEQALESKDYKIAHLFEGVSTRYVTEEEIQNAGFSEEIFRNINTVLEYQQLKAEFFGGH